jgi:hypothetical protein
VNHVDKVVERHSLEGFDDIQTSLDHLGTLNLQAFQTREARREGDILHRLSELENPTQQSDLELSFVENLQARSGFDAGELDLAADSRCD